jgi:hypothetical protein
MQIAPTEAVSGAQADVPAGPTAVERQLFDYLIDLQKGMGASRIGDPSALMGTAVHSLEGMINQAQQAFAAANTRTGSAREPASPAGAERAADGGETSASSGEGADALAYEVLSRNLDRAVALMWAAFNATLAVNSMKAATASASTLIKQQ